MKRLFLLLFPNSQTTLQLECGHSVVSAIPKPVGERIFCAACRAFKLITACLPKND